MLRFLREVFAEKVYPMFYLFVCVLYVKDIEGCRYVGINGGLIF